MSKTENGSDRATGTHGLLDIFRPPPNAPRIASPEEVEKTYRYWRWRVLSTTMVGYALFYFVRKNLSLAIPAIEDDGL